MNRLQPLIQPNATKIKLQFTLRDLIHSFKSAQKKYPALSIQNILLKSIRLARKRSKINRKIFVTVTNLIFSMIDTTCSEKATDQINWARSMLHQFKCFPKPFPKSINSA